MSDQFLVSARKYRPQTFDTVVGQQHITTTLKNAIRQNQLAHAYLFCGPRGVGKTTCARILARTLNCENPTPDMEACGVCSTCQSFNNNTSFNIFELDAASNNSVDDIRELSSQVRFAPQHGKYKVYIIDEVHMLSAGAFNAFLKTLEEPPPYAIFILATTEKHKILPTILSRCQIFDFRRITIGDIVAHLAGICQKEGRVAEEDALHLIAEQSEGCMRDALSMTDRIASFTSNQLTYASTLEHLNILDANFYFDFNDAFLSSDVAATLLQLDKVLSRGFEGEVVLNGLADFYRNLLLCKDRRMVQLLDQPAGLKSRYMETAQQTPPSFILSAISVLSDALLQYRNATNRRLHTEICLIRLCHLQLAIRPKQVAGALHGAGTTLPQGEPVKKNSEPELSPEPEPAQVHEAPAPVASPVLPPPSQVTPQPVPAAAPAPPAPVPSPSRPAPPATPVAAAAPAITPPPPPPPPPRPASANRRVSRIDLAQLDEIAGAAPECKRDLNQACIDEIYDKFQEQLRAQNKAIVVAQFAQMQAVFLEPDEVRIIAPNEMSFTCALQHRNDLITIFKNESGHPLRIVPELKAEATANEGVTVMSRQEVYEFMVRQNPNLAMLKEGMNLHIDY